MKIYFVLLVGFLLVSCGNKKKVIPITFVFEKPVSAQQKYPDYFYGICEPFTNKCQETKRDVLFKPISISRLDISNKEVETNAWYFEDMGENTVDFGKSWLSQYFKDSTIHQYLLEPSARDGSIEQFLSFNKDHTFIFSEDISEPNLYEMPVYSKIQPLKKAVAEFICTKNPESLYILILTNSKQPSVGNPISSGTPPVSSDNPFLSLLDHMKSDEERLREVDNIINTYFTTSATVEQYGQNQTISEPAVSVRDYLNSIVLYRTIEKIDILKAEKDENGKIWNIKVLEHHNTSN